MPSTTAANQSDMSDLYLAVAKETAGAYWVGISPEDFFESFMPWNDEIPDVYRRAKPPYAALETLMSMAAIGKEVKMCDIYVRIQSLISSSYASNWYCSSRH